MRIPWNNSWFQLAIIAAVFSGGLLVVDLKGTSPINIPNPISSILSKGTPPSPAALAQAQQLYSQGDASYDSGNYDAAIATFTQAIALNSKYTDAYNDRGLAYDAKGNQDQAIADYTQELQIDPTYKRGYNNRGYAYYEKGNYSSAMADYNKAIDLDTNYALAYGNRATVNYLTGNEAQALNDYTRAFQLNANYSDCYAGAAWILATSPLDNLRDGRKALDYVKKAGELTKWANADLNETVAAAYAEQGDYSSAVKYISQYLNTPNLKPGDIADAQKQLALYRSGRPYHRTNQ